MKLATRKFVRPEHLNHHQTLYAGYISECMTEAAFIAFRAGGNERDPDHKADQSGRDHRTFMGSFPHWYDKCRIHDCREKYVGSGKPVFGKDCFCDSR